MLKAFLLVGVSTLSLAATSAVALTSFGFTGGSQQFTVTTAGNYVINAYGAQRGSSSFKPGTGGAGAGVGGSFALTAGEILDIAVGGSGRRNSFGYAGGGGGSFITNAGTALLIAGGGGAGYNGSGGDGQQGTSGAAGVDGGAGGSNGAGGAGGGYHNGAGGAGFTGNGGSTSYSGGGTAFPSLAGGDGTNRYTQGAAGGFGGGGGGYYGGGGGGGFSGGGGGFGGGGGGGSFFGGTGIQSALAAQNGDGLVTIDIMQTSVTEPSSWAMMILGFGMIGSAMRRGNGGWCR